MPIAVAFDTLKFEAQKAYLEEIATKSDIKELQRDMKDLELRLLKWMFTMLTGQTALIVTLFRILG